MEPYGKDLGTSELKKERNLADATITAILFLIGAWLTTFVIAHAWYSAERYFGLIMTAEEVEQIQDLYNK